MTMISSRQTTARPTSAFTPVRAPMLQRACACGQHTSGGECEDCESKKRKTSLQRRADGPAGPTIAPPIVHDVLRSPGQPLEQHSRSAFETSFGRDFSRVRIHHSEQAAASATTVNALAYTVGRDVVFGRGQYAPQTVAGHRLLAHELAHVAQQEAHASEADDRIPIGRPDSPLEIEADRMADAAASSTSPRTVVNRLEAAVLQKDGPEQAEAEASAGKTTLTTLPGYSQKGDTCGAASLVTALVIWDRDKRDPKAPSTAVEAACNSILTRLAQHKKRTVDGWNAKKMNGELLYNTAVAAITGIRDNARVPGGNISELDFQVLGGTLYLLFVDAGKGLSAAEISALQRSLGLESGRTEGVQSFTEIFNSSILTGLKPGQIAQVGWYVKTGKPNAQGQVPVGHHMFLIGRLQDGSWFLSDQGPTPAVQINAADLLTLQRLVATASNSGSYWLFTGAISDFSTFVVGGWTGVKLLTDRASVEGKASSIVPTGTFLAEVDYGALTSGDRLVSGDFVSRHYSLADARSVNTSTFGGLIVEMPQDVFSYYRTTVVTSEDNLKVTDIDHDDSKDGLLERRELYHAWLRLCTKDSCRASLLQVY
jgi:hypothetical protein